MGYGGSNPPRRISTMSSENLKAKSHNYKLKAIEGFTLIELLVVIAIISLLSSIVLASLSQAREKAKVARAQQELLELRNAAYLLVDDTGKGPGGCPMGVDTDQEVALDDDQIDADPDFAGGGPYGGLSSVPSVDGSVCNPNAGSSDLCFFDPATRNIPKCKWTADDIVKWNGPYTRIGKDPWGHSYIYDPDYEYVEDGNGGCLETDLHQALISYGPNLTLNYPCNGPSDDIVILFEETKRP